MLLMGQLQIFLKATINDYIQKIISKGVIRHVIYLNELK